MRDTEVTDPRDLDSRVRGDEYLSLGVWLIRVNRPASIYTTALITY